MAGMRSPAQRAPRRGSVWGFTAVHFHVAHRCRICRYLGSRGCHAEPNRPAFVLIRGGFTLWHGACPVNQRSPMLKITLHDSAGEFRLTLEGRLSGPWVSELEQCWRTASSTTHGRKTVLDLGEVDFVDPAGESLLARMHAEGVELAAVTPLIRAIVRECCRAPACGTVGKVGSKP